MINPAEFIFDKDQQKAQTRVVLADPSRAVEDNKLLYVESVKLGVMRDSSSKRQCDLVCYRNVLPDRKDRLIERCVARSFPQRTWALSVALLASASSFRRSFEKLTGFTT